MLKLHLIPHARIGIHDKNFSKQIILDLKLKFHKFKNTPKKKIELF